MFDYSRKCILQLLLKTGLIRIADKGIRWPIHISPLHIWQIIVFSPPWDRDFGWVGVFRNRLGVIKWQKGRLLPRRWGIRILGFEIGDRG